METNRLEIISEILNDKFDFTDDGELKEEGFNHLGKRFETNLKIVHKPGQTGFKLYRFDQRGIDLFPYFKETSGLKQICDYLLFADNNREMYIFAIELKLRPRKSGKQLKAAEVFIQYLIESARRIGKDLDNIHIRTIRVCDSKVLKRGTREAIEYIDNHIDYRYHQLRLELIMC